MADVGVRLFFLFGKDSLCFPTGIAVWIVARYCRVKFSCSFFVVVTYFVVLCVIFSFFIPCGRICSTT